MVHLLEEGGHLDRLEHVLGIVGGGTIRADPDRETRRLEASERAYTGAEDHVGNRVVGDTDAVRGEHVDVLLGDPDDVGRQHRHV